MKYSSEMFKKQTEKFFFLNRTSTFNIGSLFLFPLAIFVHFSAQTSHMPFGKFPLPVV